MKTKINYKYHLLSFTWFLRRVLCQVLCLKDLQKFFWIYFNEPWDMSISLCHTKYLTIESTMRYRSMYLLMVYLTVASLLMRWLLYPFPNLLAFSSLSRCPWVDSTWMSIIYSVYWLSRWYISWLNSFWDIYTHDDTLINRWSFCRCPTAGGARLNLL